MSPRKRKGKRKQPPPQDDAPPPEVVAQAPATWTTEHHLVGTLREGGIPDLVGQYAGVAKIATFLPEDARERRPALWRSLVPAPPTLSHGDNSSTLMRALDCVAADLQQQQQASPEALGPNGLSAESQQLVSVLQSRWSTIFEGYCHDHVLSQLLVLGALEVVLHQYVTARARQLLQEQPHQPAASATSKSRSWSTTPAPYYRLHPNQYLTQPEADAVEATVAGSNNDEDASATSSAQTFTLNQVLSRIKTGLGLAWQRYESQAAAVQVFDSTLGRMETAASAVVPASSESADFSDGRRSSRRVQQLAVAQAEAQAQAAARAAVGVSTTGSATDEPLWAWKVVPGGRIATFATEHCRVKDDEGEEESAEADEDGDKKEPARLKTEPEEEPTTAPNVQEETKVDPTMAPAEETTAVTTESAPETAAGTTIAPQSDEIATATKPTAAATGTTAEPSATPSGAPTAMETSPVDTKQAAVSDLAAAAEEQQNVASKDSVENSQAQEEVFDQKQGSAGAPTTQAAVETTAQDPQPATESVGTAPPVGETAKADSNEADVAVASDKMEDVEEAKEELGSSSKVDDIDPAPADEPAEGSKTDELDAANEADEAADDDEKSCGVIYKDDFEEEVESPEKGGDDDKDEDYTVGEDTAADATDADDRTADLSLVAENPRNLAVEMNDQPDKNDNDDVMELDEEEEQVAPEDEEEEDEYADVVNNKNPYLKPSLKEHGPFILEWLGRKTAKNLSLADIQEFCSSTRLVQISKKKKKKGRKNPDAGSGVPVEDLLLSPLDCRLLGKALSSDLRSSSRLIFKFANPDGFTDTDFHQWETPFFGRTQFSLQVLDDDMDARWEEMEAARLLHEQQYAQEQQAYKEQKAWGTMRYRGIHGGYTVWPSWLDAVEAWQASSSQSPALADSSAPTQATSVAAGATSAVAEGEPAASRDTAANGNANVDSDLKLAQELADQEDSSLTTARASSRRTTRRAAEGGVFYGNQSSLTQKQLMDAVLRIVSLQSFKIISQLLTTVPDDSSDPIRRMRTVLGKLIWKRNQLAHVPVQTEWSDGPVWKALCKKPLFSLVTESETAPVEDGEATGRRDDDADQLLVRYVQSLHQTELQLRNLVMQHLTEVPIAIIATAADERPGSIEAVDESDFEDQESSGVVWRSSGHELLGKYVFRPEITQNTDDLTPCYWYRLQECSEAVVGEAGQGDVPAERSEIGNAKEAPLVERRIRLKAVPSWTGPPDAAGNVITYTSTGSDDMILTEAQALAGLKAGEIEQKQQADSNKTPFEHPFAARTSKITLYRTASSDLPLHMSRMASPEASLPLNMIVVGHDNVATADNEVQHRILVLPENSAASTGQDAVWADMEFVSDGKLCCKLPGDPGLYTVQQSDYHPSSQAFQECQAIVNFLERNPKAAPFLEPVDPVALNIPGYFDVIKHPMDILTIAKKLEKGHYSNIPPSQTVGRSPVARMLNGPFRKDVELMFDNAMLFNLPTEWIHQAAASLKKNVLKKIEQISSHSDLRFHSPSKERKSIYVDDDSDVDMYVDDDDGDDDYDATGRRRRKRKLQRRQALKEDSAARAVERPIRLQNVLSDSMGLRGHLANLPVNSDASTFALPQEWSCRKSLKADTVVPEQPVVEEKSEEDKELDVLIALQKQTEESEAAGYRRSTRHHAAAGAASRTSNNALSAERLEYFNTERSTQDNDEEAWPTSRLEVELSRERDHEEVFAKMYYEAAKRQAKSTGTDCFGQFANNSFPPYLGRVVPLQCPVKDGATWEIRSPYVVPALRWVIRGLIHSGHLSQVEELTPDNINSGVILSNHAYYWDSSLEPFAVLDQKEMSRRKRADQEAAEESSEEEVEMSEYEKLRAARVARNAERLRALGLA